jgi:hypothetical protein
VSNGTGGALELDARRVEREVLEAHHEADVHLVVARIARLLQVALLHQLGDAAHGVGVRLVAADVVHAHRRVEVRKVEVDHATALVRLGLALGVGAARREHGRQLAVAVDREHGRRHRDVVDDRRVGNSSRCRRRRAAACASRCRPP